MMLQYLFQSDPYLLWHADLSRPSRCTAPQSKFSGKNSSMQYMSQNAFATLKQITACTQDSALKGSSDQPWASTGLDERSTFMRRVAVGIGGTSADVLSSLRRTNGSWHTSKIARQADNGLAADGQGYLLAGLPQVTKWPAAIF